jgi:hypothetical protein
LADEEVEGEGEGEEEGEEVGGAWKRVGRVISPPMWSLNDCVNVFFFTVLV